MNFFGIGLPELAVIAAIGLLVFGPKRLPELGKTLGKTLKGFQSASSEFEKEFRTAIAGSEALPDTALASPPPGTVSTAESDPLPSVVERSSEAPSAAAADAPQA